MNRSSLVWMVALIALALAGLAWLALGMTDTPLRSTSSRSCSGCVGTDWRGTTSIRANRLTAGYEFRDASTWLISFSGGTVVLAGETLQPGCHVGRADADDALRMDDARNLRLLVPAGDETCGEDAA